MKNEGLCSEVLQYSSARSAAKSSLLRTLNIWQPPIQRRSPVSVAAA